MVDFLTGGTTAAPSLMFPQSVSYQGGGGFLTPSYGSGGLQPISGGPAPTQGGGGPSISPTQAVSLGKKAYNAYTGQAPSTPGLGAQIVNQAGSYVGFGGGTAANAGSLTSTSLSTSLGAAGIGYVAGGQIAKWTGGNPEGGSIGGAIGGFAGSAAAGTAAGAAIGSAIGIGAQALNFVIPGLGIIVGAIIGGMFGGKKPHPASEFLGFVGGDKGISEQVTYGAKHLEYDPAKQVHDITSNYIKVISEQTGLDLKGVGVRGGFGGGSGYVGTTKDNAKMFAKLSPELAPENYVQFRFNMDKPEELSSALTQLGVHIATVNGASEEQLAKIRALNVNAMRQSELYPEQSRGLNGIPVVLGGGFRGNFKGANTQTFAQAASSYQPQAVTV